MPKYTIPIDDYAKIVKIDGRDEYELLFLKRVILIWDNIIENIYIGNDEEAKRLYRELKSCKSENPELSDKIYFKIPRLEKKKYYTGKEQYIFIAQYGDASVEKGISYLQLLRQIKSQLENGTHIPSALFDKLKYWDPEKKKKEVSSKWKQIQNTWNDAQAWAEPNKERLKPQPWDGLGNGKGKVFREFVARNCSILGGSVRDNQWFSDDNHGNNNSNRSSGYIQKNDYTIKGNIISHDIHSGSKEDSLANEPNSNIIAPISRDAQDDLLSDGQGAQNFFQKLEEICAASHGEEWNPENTPPLMADLFSSKGIEDARQKVKILLALRQGQPKFRKDLIKAYKGKCAITACSIEPVLEAAHILPYIGEKSHHIGNGLLLRADLHTLFDTNLIHIDSDTFTINIDQLLYGSTYQDLQGKKVKIPKDLEKFVSIALRKRKENNF